MYTHIYTHVGKYIHNAYISLKPVYVIYIHYIFRYKYMYKYINYINKHIIYVHKLHMVHTSYSNFIL